MAAAESDRLETGNLFLDSLSVASASLLAPQLERIELPIAMTIAHAGETIDRVIFPRLSIISSVTRMRDGTDIEVMVIGRDGFHGLQAILGDGASSSESMVQFPNAAYAISVGAFVAAANADQELMRRVLRFAQASLETISQFSGCNRVHMVEERCARWLLMVADRVRSSDLSVTHEFLATMLGVRRPSVTLALGSLERAGIIETKRGRLIIADRNVLEEMACECYAQSNGITARLLGYDVRG